MATKEHRLKGKVAIVTASTAGIGLAAARRLAEEGAHVVISSRKQDHVNKIVESFKKDNLSAVGVVCHVGKQEDRKKLLDTAISTFGKLDLLVLNAAISVSPGPLAELSPQSWDKMFETNVKCTFTLLQEASPFLNSGSSVVIVGSIGGFEPQFPIAAYGVTKTALLGLTRAFAKEWGPRGIRVNLVAPGVIKTEFSKLLWDNDQVDERVIQRTPLGRLGQSPDVAGVVYFLCSEDSAFVTGETIVVAGGLSAARL